MLHKTKKSLAEELGKDWRTIDTLIDKGIVKKIYNNKGNHYYVHIINHIKEVLCKND